MKILYVINDTLKNGGTEQVAINYAKRIHGVDGIQIDFLLHTSKEEMKHNRKCQDLQKDGIKIYTATKRSVSISQNRRDIQAVLRENQYDVVHSHADCVGAYILRIAKKQGVKLLVAHSHNTKIPVKIQNLKTCFHVLYLEYCRWDIRRIATHYMACSKEAATWLFGKKKVLQDQVYYLNNAIEVDVFDFNEDVRNTLREKYLLEDCFVIGHVGSFCEQKNQGFLIDVFEEIYKKDKSARLIFIGDGEKKQAFMERVKEKFLESVITFVGNSDRVSDYLQIMDVFAFPSKWEGLSVAVIEAQAAGLPVVISDHKKIAVGTDITGNVVRASLNDKDAFIKALLDFKDFPRKSTKSIIESKGYDIGTECEKLKEFYKKIYNSIHASVNSLL